MVLVIPVMRDHCAMPQREGYFPAINCSASGQEAFWPQPPSPVDPVTGKTLYTLHYEQRHNQKMLVLRERANAPATAGQALGQARQEAVPAVPPAVHRKHAPS